MYNKPMKRHAHVRKGTARNVLTDEVKSPHFIGFSHNGLGQRSLRFGPKQHPSTPVLSSDWPGI